MAKLPASRSSSNASPFAGENLEDSALKMTPHPGEVVTFKPWHQAVNEAALHSQVNVAYTDGTSDEQFVKIADAEVWVKENRVKSIVEKTLRNGWMAIRVRRYIRAHAPELLHSELWRPGMVETKPGFGYTEEYEKLRKLMLAAKARQDSERAYFYESKMSQLRFDHSHPLNSQP